MENNKKHINKKHHYIRNRNHSRLSWGGPREVLAANSVDPAQDKQPRAQEKIRKYN